MNTLVAGLAGASFAASAAAVSAQAPAPGARAAAATRVQVGDFFFRPGTVHVRRGTTVTWTWIGAAAHNVTFPRLHQHSRTQTHGTYRLRFDRAGTFRYLCTVHGFTATIVVR